MFCSSLLYDTLIVFNLSLNHLIKFTTSLITKDSIPKMKQINFRCTKFYNFETKLGTYYETYF